MTTIAVKSHEAAILLKSDATPPTIPTGLTGTAVSATQINLSWTASTDNVAVTGYRVYRGGALITTLGNVTTFQNTGLTASTAYSYTVQAIDAAGNASAQSAAANTTTRAAVRHYAALGSHRSHGNGGLGHPDQSGWSASTDNVAVTGYRVERCQGAGCVNFAQVATTIGTSYSNTGLAAATNYRYRVRAYDAVPNYSAWTATPVSVTTVPTGATTNYAENFDDGLAQGWTATSGTWVVDVGTDHSTGNGPADISVYSGGSWATGINYHVRINNGYTNSGNLAGAVYNYQNASNYYSVTFAPTGTAHLTKVINGTTTSVQTASYSGGGPNVWFDLDVIRSGTSTTVKVNGATVFSNIVQSELGAGKVGLITTWTDARFDNVSVSSSTSVPGPVPVPVPGTVLWSCTFANSPTDCGFYEQAKVPGRATIVSNVARDGGPAVRLHTQPGDNNVYRQRHRRAQRPLAFQERTTATRAGSSGGRTRSCFPTTTTLRLSRRRVTGPVARSSISTTRRAARAGQFPHQTLCRYDGAELPALRGLRRPQHPPTANPTRASVRS